MASHQQCNRKVNEGTTGAFIYPEHNRTLTLREAVRLQSFPENFVFDGSSAQIRQQIGNAVPPMLARALVEAILPLVTRSYARARRDTLKRDSAADFASKKRASARSPKGEKLTFGVSGCRTGPG